MDADVWRIHAWGNPDLEDAMLRDHVVAVGGHELGDLSHGPDLEDLREELGDQFPDRPERGIANFVDYWRQSLYDVQPGDVVALSLSGGRVGHRTTDGRLRVGRRHQTGSGTLARWIGSHRIFRGTGSIATSRRRSTAAGRSAAFAPPARDDVCLPPPRPVWTPAHRPS